MGKRFLMAPSFLSSHFRQERSIVTPLSLLKTKNDSMLANLPGVEMVYFFEISQQRDFYFQSLYFFNRYGWKTRVL